MRPGDGPSHGRPAIVVATVDLSVDWRRAPVYWGLPRLCIETVLGIRDGEYGEVQVHTAVPPEAIVDIWQPGHPNYDRHDALPRS